MANEPTIIGSAGWRTVFDYSTGAGDSVRIRVRMGPYITLDGEIAALRAALDVQTLDPSVSPGSAIATIRCTYKSIPSGGLDLGERRSPTFAITPPVPRPLPARPPPALRPPPGRFPPAPGHHREAIEGRRRLHRHFELLRLNDPLR